MHPDTDPIRYRLIPAVILGLALEVTATALLGENWRTALALNLPAAGAVLGAAQLARRHVTPENTVRLRELRARQAGYQAGLIAGAPPPQRRRRLR